MKRMTSDGYMMGGDMPEHDPTLVMVAKVARKMTKRMPNGKMDYSKEVKKASRFLKLPGER